MLIKVTLGEPMWRKVGAREKEIEFGGISPDTTLNLAHLASRLGLKLIDTDGALLVTVNGKLIPSEKASRFRLRDRDHVEFHMMLTGG